MAEERTVLVADDEPLVLRVLERALREDGYNVDTANNGVDAVVQFVNNDYKLVLLDIAMPRMTGTDALRIMKAVKPSIPVVTFTGHVGQGEMAETVRLGAVSSLPKPVRLDDVKRAVALAAVA